jgi:hypothetical protein
MTISLRYGQTIVQKRDLEILSHYQNRQEDSIRTLVNIQETLLSYDMIGGQKAQKEHGLLSTYMQICNIAENIRGQNVHHSQLMQQ